MPKLSHTNLKNLIRGARHQGRNKFRVRVEEMRQYLPESSFGSFIDEIKVIAKLDPPSFNLSNTWGINHIYTRPPFAPISLERSLAWAASILEFNISSLAKYVRHINATERAVYSANYESALRHLDALESDCGISIGAIELKTALLQEVEGLAGQRHYVNSITSSSPAFLTAFLVILSSERNEPSTSVARFTSSVDNNIERFHLSLGDTLVAKYHLLGTLPDEAQLPLFLDTLSTSSLIDLYEGFLAVVKFLVVSEYHTQISFSSLLKRLLPSKDLRVNKLLYLVEPDRTLLSDVRIRDMSPDLSQYASNPELALKQAEISLASNPMDIHAYLVKATATLDLGGRLDASNLPNIIAGHIVSILNYSSDHLEQASELLKTTLNFKALPVLTSLKSQHVLSMTYENRQRKQVYVDLFYKSQTLNPLDVLALPRSFAFDYLSVVQEAYGDTEVVDLAYQAAGIGKRQYRKITPDQKFLLEYTAVLNKRERTDANQLAEKMMLSSQRTLKITGALLLANSFAERRQYGSLIELAAKWCSEQENLVYLLPLKDALNGKSLKTLSLNKSSIATPIAFHLLQKLADNHKVRQHIGWLIDDFLVANGLDTPSKIVDILENFDRNQVVYFLRSVCTYQALEACRNIPSSQQILEERLRIYSLLTELDSANENLYRQEITELSTTKYISEGIQLLDRSRVYVNTDAITRWAQRELRESYQRMVQLLEVDVIVSKVEQLMKRMAKESAEEQKYYFLNVYQETDELMLGIIKALREQFLNSPDHGLDSFLSMRIRHGTLSGTLRGPLDDHKLITVLQDDGAYKRNDYWLDKLHLYGSQRDEVSEHLVWFSQAYDKIIELSIKPKLQIKSADHPEGLFDLSIDPSLVAETRKLLMGEKQASFEELLEVVFSHFRTALQKNLNDSRQSLLNSVKPKIDALFRELSTRLSTTLFGTLSHHELSSTVTNAFTEVQQTFGRVVEWLNVEHPNDIGQRFTLRQTIDITINSALQSLRGFDLKFKVNDLDNSQAIITTNILKDLSDVMFIALDNVRRHAGSAGAQDVGIVASYTQDGSLLLLHVENALDSEALRDIELADLQAIRESIASGEYRNRVSAEGRSGFLKIQRIGTGYKRHHLDFGITEDKRFHITLTFEISPNLASKMKSAA